MGKGVWKEYERYEMNKRQGTILGMQEDEAYKYLGYLQTEGIAQNISKQKATDTYMKRLKAILRSELSARNISKAFL